MIIYFADRNLNILGQASTGLPSGLIITDDRKIEDTELGVATFECDINFDNSTRAKVETWTANGNYILRSSGNENEFYTIIDTEIDTKKQKVYIYAEDDGLDLINDVVDVYEASEPHPISYYINMYANGSGWEIGINEVEGLTRQLTFDSEETACARLLKIAEAFNNCELSYSFDIAGLQVVKKYINIYEKRGKDTGLQLRLNKEIDRIITTKSIANLATALRCVGGTPDDSDDPITLLGYEYDDGDIYVDGNLLKSRNALENWSRFLWRNDDSQQAGGHIVRQFSFDTISQEVLCVNAIEELKRIRDIEINFDVDIKNLSDDVQVGDRINIIDDKGELYVSTRVLSLETSIANQTRSAILGEHLIKGSGISQKVAQLAAEFAKQTVSVERANRVSNAAKQEAQAAKTIAEAAEVEANAAQAVADNALTNANEAAAMSAIAQAKALAAEAAVNTVEESVSSIETTVNNAQAAADNAYLAATTAQEKANEAATAAQNAQTQAQTAAEAAEAATEATENAVSKADTAIGTANTAQETAREASDTAQAAKLDAEQAKEDISEFESQLETVKTTMQADYARKTELTEATETLQSQITQNAGEISSTVSRLTTIDETANNAAELAGSASEAAALAQTQVNEAKEEAQAAQTAADQAVAAATAAQTEADNAKAAANTAQSVATQAQENLAAAQADLATVTSRVGATEEEILAAQQAVIEVQAAAEEAQGKAQTAVANAATAQSTANTAVSNAEAAQAKANEAAETASAAQLNAEEAKGNAAAAIQRANEAANTATTAQNIANTAKTNAETAQAKANEAASTAATAQAAATNAAAVAAQAQENLETAQENLEAVTSRVGATEAEVAAAQAAVDEAQAAANLAKLEAETAQATADTAKTNAANAKTAADNAKTAADNAQEAADEAAQAAAQAQADVNALTTRVTNAETAIVQNTEQIALRATKAEIATTLGGYYTKAQTDAALTVKADQITSTVSATYATKQQVNDIEIGGRNFLPNTDFGGISQRYERLEGNTSEGGFHYYPTEQIASGIEYTLSAKIRGSANVNFYEINTGGNKAHGWIAKADLSETEYRKFTITFIVDQDKVFGDVYICTRWGEQNTLVGDWFEIDQNSLKLEKGNKATDWTPATEDTEAGINAAQAKADEAAEAASTANSQISQLADKIDMLVSTDDNGASLFRQTENGFVFATSELETLIKGLQESLDGLSTNYGSTAALVSILNQTVTDIGVKTDYVNIGTYDGEPCIELGQSDSEYKLLITNTKILFQVGSAIPTRIETDGLVTENITVEQELKHKDTVNNGYYVWAVRSNGNYGLQWKEGE